MTDMSGHRIVSALGVRLPAVSDPPGLTARRRRPGFAGLPATDDCGIVLQYLPEVAVHAVMGSERNIKITYPRDLAIAETLLRS
jgi:hypothetical protein